MSENPNKTAGNEQWTAYQKIWTDTFNRMLQLGVTFTPESTPPEFLRQLRTSIFQAIAQSWDEFLRSPQFLDGMKQWMENAIAFRKLTNECLARAHDEAHTASAEDIGAVLVAMRHMEKRVLDRVDKLEAAMSATRSATNGGASPPRRKPARTPQTAGRKGAKP